MAKLNKNILVIGGSGFIGSTLIPSLLSDDHDVTILNRGNKKMHGAKQLVADRNNPVLVNQIAQSATDFDIIIDTSSYNRSQTEIMWKAFSKKTKHWIHLSSAAVYKETPGRFPNENDEIGGAKIWGEYGIEKSEIDSFLIDRSSDIAITVFRPPYLYGPRNDNDRETFIWNHHLLKKPIIVPATGQTPIQFLHVEDLVNAFKIAMAGEPESGIRIYNIASNEQLSFVEWIKTLATISQTKAAIVFEGNSTNFSPRQYFPFRDYPCCVQTGLIRRELGWNEQYDIATGFAQTFKTYDANFLVNKIFETSIENQILDIIQGKSST